MKKAKKKSKRIVLRIENMKDTNNGLYALYKMKEIPLKQYDENISGKDFVKKLLF